MKRLIPLFLLCALGLTACYYDKYDEIAPQTVLQGCDTVNITYKQGVTRIMASYCVGCHNPSAASGSVILTTYASVQTQAASGRLLGGIKHLPGYKPMPQGSMLDDCNIKVIEKWVAMGMPNN
jgi:hypothetical protein